MLGATKGATITAKAAKRQSAMSAPIRRDAKDLRLATQARASCVRAETLETPGCIRVALRGPGVLNGSHRHVVADPAHS
eukprot:1727428-Amphidinium_carterae.1